MRKILNVTGIILLFSIFLSCSPDYYKMDELVDWKFLFDTIKIGFPFLLIGILIVLLPNVILVRFRKNKDETMTYAWVFFSLGLCCIGFGIFILLPLLEYIRFITILLFVIFIVVAIIGSIIGYFLEK